MINRQSKLLINVDWPLVLLYFLMVALGWMNVYAAVYSPDNVINIFSWDINSGKQLAWIGTAVVLMIVILVFPAGVLRLALLRVAHCGRQRIGAGFRRFRRVHCVHALQRDVNRPIDRCTSAREYSRHTKGMVLVKRKGHIPGAMRDDDLLAKAIAQRRRDFGAEDRSIRIGESLAVNQL